ncbi:flagellar hook-basal body complex protein FliE [Bdellovibrionota bacterium FG-1]
MSNLSIENLSRIVQTGDIEGMMSGGRVAQEMQKQGMAAPAAPGPAGANSFSDLLRTSVDQVNEQQQQADHAIKELVAGRSKNIHETMLTIERADMSLKLMTQVRNKILDAYKEVMRMQV